MHVGDVPTSITFYTKRLGFTLSNPSLATDVAEIIGSDGDPFLLIGPGAGDVTPYLKERHRMLQPGQQLYFLETDLGRRRAELIQRGITEGEERETSWGDRLLTMRDPDGYAVSFLVRTQFSPDDLLALYMRGPGNLEDALRDLSEQELDLRREPGEWSIRQIVHHIVDGDDLWTMGIKAALANSGCLYSHDWYTSDNACAEPLDYAGRAIDTAVALFRANRAYVRQMLEHLPGAWERYVLFRWYYAQEAEQLTVGAMVRMQAIHAFQHVDEIYEVRRKHQC